MDFTRNILDLYDTTGNSESAGSYYLKRQFGNTGVYGYYHALRKDPVASKWDKSIKTQGYTIDEDNTYEINSIGCRGEVYKNPEIIASGCSITFGLGVPELGRWTNFLSEKFNKNVLNLGSPGASVESICNQIIQYCMNNKMPKEIFCLMPDFFRSMVVADKEFYKSKVDRGEVGKRDYLEIMFCNPQVYRDKDMLYMEITNKKYIEDYTSPHQLILDSVNSIYILESFCLSNNIKLHWSTWDGPTALIIEELKKIENFKLKNYTSIFPFTDMEHPLTQPHVDCCSLHDSKFKDHVSWRQGSDYVVINNKKDVTNSHPGIHFQHHMADMFYDLSNKNNKV
jgi:hypothetical protein